MLLCQDWVCRLQSGDSGCRVFEQAGDNEVRWPESSGVAGRSDGAPVFMFSAMEKIEQELGSLRPRRSILVAQ